MLHTSVWCVVPLSSEPEGFRCYTDFIINYDFFVAVDMTEPSNDGCHTSPSSVLSLKMPQMARHSATAKNILSNVSFS